jgi:hypothetical protein
MNFEGGDCRFLGVLRDAIKNNKIVRIYAPRCMRYYYDDSGNQQIISSIEDFHYVGADGISHIKRGSKYLSEVEKSLFIARALASFGIAIEVVLPVMDNELLRPQIMNTQENCMKIEQFIKELSNNICTMNDENLTLRVVSSLKCFGNPFKEGYVPEESDTEKEKIEYIKSLGISKKTFDTGVEGEFKRNKKDKTRNKYYLSKDFAIISELYGLLEAYFQGIKMSKLGVGINCAGVIIGIPNGASDLMSIFKKILGIIPFYEKRLV